jgi:hypothetical protein
VSRRKSSPFVIDVVEEYLHTNQARESKTYAACCGFLPA